MSHLLTRDETERAIEFMRASGFTGALRVLVRPEQYGVVGDRWCMVEHVSPGGASVYPIKVSLRPHVPHGGQAQFKLGEVIAARVTVEALEHPDWPADLRGER